MFVIGVVIYKHALNLGYHQEYIIEQFKLVGVFVAVFVLAGLGCMYGIGLLFN